MMLYLVRVNLPNGELPPALLGDDLPHKMIDIEFCVTNLRSLPDDFDLKWPAYASIYFEASNFSEVPQTLIRLSPYDVCFAFNPISTIPAALFEGNIAYLHIGGTLISELPQDVGAVSALEQLRVDITNLSFFWKWIDPVILNTENILSDVPTTVIASNTPYCADLQRIYSGDQIEFSVPSSEEYSKILSNASLLNRSKLEKAVSCIESPQIMCTLQMHDTIYAMGGKLNNNPSNSNHSIACPVIVGDVRGDYDATTSCVSQ